MASSGKNKTTMAKLNREHRLRERRMEKAARKDARKRERADEASGLGLLHGPERAPAVDLD
jgi:hypothetical protein